MRLETTAIGNAWDYDAEWGSASIRGYRRDPSDKKLLSFYFLYVDDRVRASFLPRIERITDSDWELADKVFFSFFSSVIDRLGLRFGFSEEAVWQESMTLVPHVKLLRLLKRGWKMGHGFKQLAANLFVNRHEIKGYWYILGFAVRNLRQESLDFRMDWWCFIIRGRGSVGGARVSRLRKCNRREYASGRWREAERVRFFICGSLNLCRGVCMWVTSLGRP